MSEKKKGPREASEARRNNIPHSTYSSENQAELTFPIRDGLHQGSGLSPFLFTVVLDVISEEFRCGLPCELLFADDLTVVTDTEEEMQRRWFGWQIGLESI